MRVPQVQLQRVHETKDIAGGLRVEPGRQGRQLPGRRHGICPEDDQADGAGRQERVADERVLVTPPVVKPERENDHYRKQQPEVHQVRSLGPEQPLAYPGVHVVFPEESESALQVDDVHGVGVGDLRPADDSAAHCEVEAKGHANHHYLLQEAAPSKEVRQPPPGRGRSALALRLHPPSSRHLTANSRTGSSNPLRVTSPVSANRNPLPAHSSRTASDARTSPPWAWAAMRAARITVAPHRSPSSSMGSPAFSPMRMRMGSGASARPSLRSGDPSRASERAEPPAFRSAKARWRARAHSTALVTDPKEAMKPSPLALTSVPPCAFTTSRVIPSC